MLCIFVLQPYSHINCQIKQAKYLLGGNNMEQEKTQTHTKSYIRL